MARTCTREMITPEAAPRTLQPRIPQDSTTREAIYERVSVLLERGRYHDAENILSRGLEIYPESVDLLKELGVLYHLQGRYGKAARTFTRVMNITGEGKQSLSWKIASLYHKALEEFEGPDPGLSLASFDQILALNPSDREALAGKIAAFRVLGRLDEAQRLVEAGLSLVPPGPSILYQEGWLRMDQDRPDLAREAFERAALADPAWPDPVLSRALALERLGRGEGGRDAPPGACGIQAEGSRAQGRAGMVLPDAAQPGEGKGHLPPARQGGW